MLQIQPDYLLAAGIIALAIYLVAIYIEKGKDRKLSDREWRTMELARTLAELCQSSIAIDPPMKAHIFLNQDGRTFRWSTNGFCLEGEVEICTIEAAGVGRLRKYIANKDMLMGIASDILHAYRKKKENDSHPG